MILKKKTKITKDEQGSKFFKMNLKHTIKHIFG